MVYIQDTKSEVIRRAIEHNMAASIRVGDDQIHFSRVQSSSTSLSRNENENVKKYAPPRISFGFKELHTLKVWRAATAELLGTAALVFAMDTTVISSNVAETKTPLVVTSLLIAIFITILVLATVSISGGHINPIVSFAAMLIGHMPISRAFIYILAQSTGGVLGALAVKSVVSSSVEDAFSLGGCTLKTATGLDTGGNMTVSGIETSAGLWLEILFTFMFLFASVRIAFDERQAKAMGLVMVCTIVGIVLGLLVFVSSTVTTKKGYGGAGMNPARCLGPAIVRGGHLWDGHWVFWAGPAIACVAFSVYLKIIPS